MIANIAAAYISMHFGFKGENFCPVSACATGNHSIGEAMRAIRHGYQDVVVCGGTENMSAAPYAVPTGRYGAGWATPRCWIP